MLEKSAAVIATIALYCIIGLLWDVNEMKEVVVKYWYSNYRIILKKTSKENLRGSLQTQFLQHNIDPDKLFHAVLFIYHVLELLSLGYYEFLRALISLPNSLIWGILEVGLINRSANKIVGELAVTNNRFDMDGIFFVDLDKLGDAQKPTLPDAICT